jgi:hypothetical protein
MNIAPLATKSQTSSDDVAQADMHARGNYDRSSLFTREFNSATIAKELNEDGFVCIDNVVDPDWIERARTYVRSLVEKNGNRYFALNWPARESGSPPNELTYDPQMVDLMRDLAQLGCPSAQLDDEIYTSLRVVAGKSGDEKSLLHHYDKYVITVLVPILIPEGPKRMGGELVVFPNRRNYRKSTLFNIIEKAVVQSGWYQRWITRRLPAGDFEGIKYLKPGNIYLFWGYRTYHSNFPVASDLVRATLLLHYGDPHPSSLILKMKKEMQVRDKRRIRKKKGP